MPGAQVAWIDISSRIFLVNPRDLICEKSVASKVVINTCWPKIDEGDGPVLLMYQAFGLDLGSAVRQVRLKRPVLIDHIIRSPRFVRKHRTRKHELFDLKRLKGAQEFFSAANRDLFIKRARFAGKIKISRKVDHRSDAGP